MAWRPAMTKQGHAVDADAVGAQIIGVHRFGICIGGQVGIGLDGVEAELPGEAGQGGRVADIHPIGEMGVEHRFHRRHAEAGLLAHHPAHQAVRVDGGGGAQDTVEAEGDAFDAADIGDGGVEAAGAFLATEFADDIVVARHAAARHVRVEQEGAPDQLGMDVRPAAQGAQQAAGAEIAPGADQVVHDLYAQPGVGRRAVGGDVDVQRCDRAGFAVLDHASTALAGSAP